MLLGCQNNNAPAETSSFIHHVDTLQAAETEIIAEITSFGTISFLKKTDISAAADGKLERLYVEEGDEIIKSQPLLLIENVQLEIRKRQAASAVAAAKASVALAEARLWEGKMQIEARLISIDQTEIELQQKEAELIDFEETLHSKEKIYQAGGLSEETMDALKMGYQAAKTEYLSLAKQLEIKRVGLRDEDIIASGSALPPDGKERRALLVDLNCRTLTAELSVAHAQLETALSELESADRLLQELSVRSPESGIVGARYFSEGERVREGEPLLTLFDTSKVYAVFPVQEDEAQLLSEGMAVEVAADSLGGAVYHANVRLISPTVDPQSGSVTVKAVCSNPDKRFKPGMFIRVRVIYGDPRSAIILPITAIRQKSGKRAEVFTIVNGRAFQKEVRIGEEREGSLEILQGLKAGEIIVDSPSPLLKEGEKVDYET
jgi:HlyD family secretion protein